MPLRTNTGSDTAIFDFRYLAEKDTIAAIKLQAVFRSQLVRKRVRAYKEGMRAATIIQARW